MSTPADELPIEPRGPLDAQLEVPGSKSLTNRALVAAALARGRSQLHGALESDDTQVMRRALRTLGIAVDDPAGKPWTVEGQSGQLQEPADTLWMGGSGTSARFLTAAATLCNGPVSLDGDARMRERPIGDLAEALQKLGADLEVEGVGECPPVTVRGGGLTGGHVEIDARRSSQFVSAVLLAAPYAQSDVTLHLADGILVSRPYVELTLQVMQAFGVKAGWRGDGNALEVAAGQCYSGCEYHVEPDASAAVYAFGAAAIAGGSVRIEGFSRDSIQADLGLLPILERMGCDVAWDATGVRVTGPEGGLRSPGEIDMNALPDAAMALSVVALFADGRTRIGGIGNLRIKETDRLHALETEIRRLGAEADAGPDHLEIRPGPLAGARIETYNDHRMAMSFALAGLRVPGVVIADPGCVSKTWPDFFSVFGALR